MATLTDNVKQQFQHLIADHEMHVFRDEKPYYRHLRFHGPETRTYWFDLVTWPGYLAINGDLISGFTFSRTTDMFEFFAEGYGTDDPFYINPQYWSEKITCPLIDVREYDHDAYMPEMDEVPWEWNRSFLLSCHAIRWGIDYYRRSQ